MHPLSLLSPFLPRVFHVTNSGCSSDLRGLEKRLLRLEFLLVALLASLTPGVELALCTLEELVVDGEGAKRREIAAGLYEVSVAAGSASSSPSASSVVVVGSALYFSQRSSTWCSGNGDLFSRLATRLSKQYAQCAGVAMAAQGKVSCSWLGGVVPTPKV